MDNIEREMFDIVNKNAEIKRQEQEVIEYLQVCHNGDINELKKELKE